MKKMLAALLLASFGLSGCIVVPVHDGYGYRSHGYYGGPGYYRYRDRYP
jgi:hypothetical protein